MEYYVTTFKIEAVGESFYANGRHQCKVQISVLKQAFENGDYVKKPLTESEIAQAARSAAYAWHVGCTSAADMNSSQAVLTDAAIAAGLTDAAIALYGRCGANECEPL